MSWDVRFALTGTEVLKSLPRFIGTSIDEGLAAIVRRVLGWLRRNTPVGDRGTGGELKGSWEATGVDKGSIAFGTDVLHGPYVESGGPPDEPNAANWPHEGKRTKTVDGRIFSRQAPGGIVAPFLSDERLIDRLFDTIINEISASLEKVSRGA